MIKEEQIRRKADRIPVMECRCEQGVDYLVFPAIERTGVVKHLMSTRTGGVSEGMFATMNLSFTRGDKEEHVEENYRRIAALLGRNLEDFVCSDQTHTTNIRHVTASDAGKGVVRPKDYRDVDGMITNVPGLVLATFYADCVPLLFVDPVRRAVGLSHSGWRGTAAGMGVVTVKAMQEAFGSKPEDILAGIGPSICQDCYEVSEDVAEAFRELFRRDALQGVPVREKEVLRPKEGGKYQLDLWKANEAICLSAGICQENISVTDICTCCNSSWLFSHRASGGKRGNLGMFVTLEERRSNG